MAKIQYNYVVRGNVRGEISRHRKIECAFKSRSDDQRHCQAQGGYSDGEVYEVLHAESNAAGRLRMRHIDICEYECL